MARFSKAYSSRFATPSVASTGEPSSAVRSISSGNTPALGRKPRINISSNSARNSALVMTSLPRRGAARMGRNPATGEAIKIKASKKVAFRAAKDLKMAV
jgi:Bacterial DNA-binding protein